MAKRSRVAHTTHNDLYGSALGHVQSNLQLSFKTQIAVDIILLDFL